MHCIDNLFAFNGLAPRTVCSIDLNPFDEGGLFGSGDDEKAKGYSKDAIKAWRELKGQIPGATVHTDVHDLLQGQTTYDQSLSYADDPLNSASWNAADIHGYQAGPDMRYEGIAYADPGQTSWDGASSAYDGLPSAWDNYAPDQTGREQQLDASGYFRDAMHGGLDAQAEADYARKSAMADQQRRSQSEAALSQLEQRGQGGGSEGLLAELVNNQGAAANKYQAGLDAAAMGQARRDNAAAQYGAFGTTMYGQDMDSAARQAQGQDSFGLGRAAGQDAFAVNKNNATDAWNTGVRDYNADIAKYNADQANAALKYNHDRSNAVRDMNTGLQNDIGQWNKVGQQQQRFNNQMAVVGGMTGALGGAANVYQQTAFHPLQDMAAPIASNVIKSQADPKKASS